MMLSWALCSRCLFFFSSRRRHTRFDCDWSSDVCSSDLDGTHWRFTKEGGVRIRDAVSVEALSEAGGSILLYVNTPRAVGDRKSVVEGKSVDLGGGRIIKKKKHDTYLSTFNAVTTQSPLL